MSKVKSKVDVIYSIRITQEMENKIQAIAAEQGRTKTNVIRHFLNIGLGSVEDNEAKAAVTTPIFHHPI